MSFVEYKEGGSPFYRFFKKHIPKNEELKEPKNFAFKQYSQKKWWIDKYSLAGFESFQ